MKNIFIWDYKEQVPFIEMLKFSRKHPELHLYQVCDNGSTFEAFIFSKNTATAKKELYSSMNYRVSQKFIKFIEI